MKSRWVARRIKWLQTYSQPFFSFRRFYTQNIESLGFKNSAGICEILCGTQRNRKTLLRLLPRKYSFCLFLKSQTRRVTLLHSPSCAEIKHYHFDSFCDNILHRNLTLLLGVQIIQRWYRSLNGFIPFVAKLVVYFIIIGKIRFADFHFPFLVLGFKNRINMK